MDNDDVDRDGDDANAGDSHDETMTTSTTMTTTTTMMMVMVMVVMVILMVMFFFCDQLRATRISVRSTSSSRWRGRGLVSGAFRGLAACGLLGPPNVIGLGTVALRRLAA